MVRLTLHSTIAPPCSTAPHSSLMSVILNGYGDTGEPPTMNQSAALVSAMR